MEPTVSHEITDRTDYEYIVSALIRDMTDMKNDLDCMIRAAEQSLAANRAATEK
jgi:hypothetical protein